MGFVCRFRVAIEEPPSGGSNKQAATNTDGIEREAEEGQDERAEKGCGEQEKESVDADAAGDA